MLGVVAIFTLGSGLCGGANSSAMLIAGRAIQGAGSGGIQLLNGKSCFAKFNNTAPGKRH